MIEEFEKWALSRGYDLWKKDGIYLNITVQIIFPAFKAGWLAKSSSSDSPQIHPDNLE